MNSIWLKIAGVAVVAVLVIVVLGRMGGDQSTSEPPQKDKTFYGHGRPGQAVRRGAQAGRGTCA